MRKKKQLSVYLSDDLINILDNYKEEYKLKNRTAAIERILIEWDLIKNKPIVINVCGNSDNVIRDAGESGMANNKKDYKKSQEDINMEMIDSRLDDIYDDLI